MSWSISYIGSPEKIIAALDRHSESISGKSKEEFDKWIDNETALEKAFNNGTELAISNL